MFFFESVKPYCLDKERNIDPRILGWNNKLDNVLWEEGGGKQQAPRYS